MMVAKDQSQASGEGKFTAIPAAERPELWRLIEESKAKVALMSPDEKQAMFLEQRQSWVRGEMGLDRKTDSQVETRIMAAIEGARPNAAVTAQPVFRRCFDPRPSSGPAFC
jgi:hypothetical protein